MTTALGRWFAVRDGDDRALALYLRHYSAKYNRFGPQTALRGAERLVVGPGEKYVLLTPDGLALFTWRYSIRDDGQEGVNCTIFRNEGAQLSSDLIREADELAWARWPDQSRHFTFVDPREIRSTNPGFCFLKAGWRRCGTTKSGLHILEAQRALRRGGDTAAGL